MRLRHRPDAMRCALNDRFPDYFTFRRRVDDFRDMGRKRPMDDGAALFDILGTYHTFTPAAAWSCRAPPAPASFHAMAATLSFKYELHVRKGRRV